MTATRAFLKRYPVLIYYILTFAISWSAILLVIGFEGILGTRHVPDAVLTLVYMATLLGPSTAGLLMTGLMDGRAGFRELFSRLRQWRVGAGWYVVALLTAPLLMLASLFVLSRASPAFVPTIFASSDASAVLVSGIVAGIMVGIFEELGWTGFAIPRLRQRHGVLATGLIAGVLWGLWHGPLFLGDVRSTVGIPPAMDLAIRLFSFLPAFRLLMVWVYDRTRSLLVAMLMHMSLTGCTLILQPQVTGLDVVRYDLVFAGGLWAFAAAIALVNRGKLDAGRPRDGRAS